VRHGAGYTEYEHSSHALEQRVRVFVAPDAPVKLVQVRLANLAARPRRVTATYYAEWVLGVHRDAAQQYVIPEFDGETQALLARNPYDAEFGERVAFLGADRPAHGWTADRTEFLGRLGSLARPAALERIGLARRAEAGSDPCAALQVHLDLPAGGAEEVTFVLGQGATRAETLALAARFHHPGAAAEAWQAVGALWDDVLSAVTVETPDPAMNLLLNRWLPYQALACRIWGRTAFYQSSGAYGFRDQLQDVLALLWARPKIARAQLLRAAAHQFEAGDVLHWWHPPSGRGVRTRISDDLLWLPYVTARYVVATGDTGVLDERVPFLRGDPLRVGEEERYGHYPSTEDGATLLEHCRRALQRGVTAGPHGLPLMGAGDWNDGMNRVGAEGRGESVWLGWFAYRALHDFAALCDRVGLADEAEAQRARAAHLHRALEEQGWDGGWYRRAYYDDGTPLGSAQNRECRIDSIAQSWAVLSGAPRTPRTQQAVQAVLDNLVRWDDGLILLLTPPFDRTPRDPGYIKGYLPGVRENGGQYTHAATWVAWAMADLGDGDTAARLFGLLGPIRHADTPQKALRYVVEPYVVAADVYGAPPHTGRGGWTWYTGSSGWLYRVGIEAILGLRLEGGELRVEPRLPRDWPGFTATVSLEDRVYRVRVARDAEGHKVTVEEGRQEEKARV
jgi:cyclic beta-1,2-glucan synthetase